MEKSLVMPTLILILLLTATTTAAQIPGRHFPDPQANKYKVNATKVAGWGLAAIGGLSDGLLEGYTFDGRTSFERKWNADRYGYFGSESWRNVYNGGNPESGFKSPIHKWTGAWDFYHHADDLRKAGYISGGVMIGIGGKQNIKWWHYALDFGIGFTASAVTKSAAMWWVRK